MFNLRSYLSSAIHFDLIAITLRLWSTRILKSALSGNDYMALMAMAFASDVVSIFLAVGFAGIL
jgi:hypothetical protein